MQQFPPLDQFLRHALRGRTTQRDSADARFIAVEGADPVETEVARFLYALVRLSKAHSVVETGTNIGISSLCLTAALHEDDLPGSSLNTFDIEDHGVQAASDALGYGKRLLFHCRSSLESNLTSALEKIDLLFLDSLPCLLAEELNLFFPLLRRGSIIAVHDSRLFAEKRLAIQRFKQETGWHELFVSAGRGVSLLFPDDDGSLQIAQPPEIAIIFDDSIAKPAVSRIPLSWSAPIRRAMLGDVTSTQIVIDVFNRALNSAASHVAIAATVSTLPQIESFIEQVTITGVPADLFAANGGTPLPFFRGRQEFEDLAARSHDATLADPRHITVPCLTADLLIVNRKLAAGVGGLSPKFDDLSWSLALLATQLMFANGTLLPERTAPPPDAEALTANREASISALKAARIFYKSLPAALRGEPTRSWRRFSRQYLYGMQSGQSSVASVIACPSKWPSLISCRLGL